MRSTVSWWRFRSCKFIFPNFKQVNQNMEMMQNFGDGLFFSKKNKKWDMQQTTHPWPLVDGSTTPSTRNWTNNRLLGGQLTGQMRQISMFLQRSFLEISRPEARRRRSTNRLLVGGWTNPKLKKYAEVKLGSSSLIFGVKIKKYLKPPPGLRRWHCRPGDDSGTLEET